MQNGRAVALSLFTILQLGETKSSQHPVSPVVIFNVMKLTWTVAADGHCVLYQHVLGDIVWNTHTRKLVNQSRGMYLSLPSMDQLPPHFLVPHFLPLPPAVQFMRLQEEARQEILRGDSISAKSLLQYSQLYRAALHECVLGLRADWSRPLLKTSDVSIVSSGDEGEGKEELGSFYAMLELVWHLCEVLFVEVLPAGCLVQQLWEWIQRNASE